MVDLWSERFRLLIEAAERDAVRGHDTAPPLLAHVIDLVALDEKVAEHTFDRSSVPGLRTRMCEYTGRAPVYVAFHENCSDSLVRKIRAELGLHRITGEPLTRNERPLTNVEGEGV